MILPAEVCGCAIEQDLTILNSPICGGTLLFMVLLESYIRRNCDISTPCKNIKSVNTVETNYDFIVVGSGAAGSVIAGRLSEDPNNKVLLIEAGGPDPIGSRIPSFYRTYWGNKDVDWDFRTELDDYCLDQGEKGCQWPRGKVLGGCTVLNGMMYHRGHAADYEDWVLQGAEGWSWKENLPFFDRTEGNKQIGSLVDGEYHSSTGPMPVQRFNYQGRVLKVLIDALNHTGFPIIDDMNNPNTPIGFTIAQTFNENGQRYTTARAFLHSERLNLSVLLHSTVTRVIIEDSRAVGVEFVDKNGNKKIVRVTKEVILSAGALGSPHILLMSGIGPAETLNKFNIPVIADVPTGNHLKNHVGVTLIFILTKVNNTRSLDWNALMQYMLSYEGPMSSTGLTQLTGLLYSSLADVNRQQPDLQFFFNGYYAECAKTGIIGECIETTRKQQGVNVTANIVSLIPRSEGYLTLQSSDPLVPPIFYPEFFKHEDDMVMIKDGFRYIQRIFDDQALQEKYGIELEEESIEGCNSSQTWSDDWMECMARLHTDPQNHQMGTAAIGRVIDTELRVYNVDKLRVVDASAIPSPLTGNPQAAIMMVSERAAEFIKQTYQ